ncbi:hypothetical protein JTB14_016759 [Gonioctena quinquepunctata]|nr:hypothetical protein JTB14_016759 [Gonioctena quinquepunctata]
MIQNFEGTTSDSVYCRAQTRLTHIISRIKRIHTGSENEKTFKNESYATAPTLEAELDEHLIDIDKTTPVNNTTSTVVPTIDLEFHVGDKVWKRNKVLSNASKNFSSKLAPRYSLCTIAKKKSKLVHDLENENGSNAGEWHLQDLKPYHGSTSDLSESDEEQMEKNLKT